MSKSAVITTRVDAETLELVDRLSKARGRSRAWVAAEAIRAYALQESELLALVEEARDDVAAGRVVDHEEVLGELDAMIARHRARCG